MVAYAYLYSLEEFTIHNSQNPFFKSAKPALRIIYYY
jgi:hypothetical protein